MTYHPLPSYSSLNCSQVNKKFVATPTDCTQYLGSVQSDMVRSILQNVFCSLQMHDERFKISVYTDVHCKTIQVTSAGSSIS